MKIFQNLKLKPKSENILKIYSRNLSSILAAACHVRGTIILLLLLLFYFGSQQTWLTWWIRTLYSFIFSFKKWGNLLLFHFIRNVKHTNKFNLIYFNNECCLFFFIFSLSNPFSATFIFLIFLPVLSVVLYKYCINNYTTSS